MTHVSPTIPLNKLFKNIENRLNLNKLEKREKINARGAITKVDVVGLLNNMGTY